MPRPQPTYGIAAGVNKIDQEPKPANVYAFSKVQLDNLARRFARENPSQIVVGLRYFNVYGPREAHKGAASSMILQLAQQIRRASLRASSAMANKSAISST